MKASTPSSTCRRSGSRGSPPSRTRSGRPPRQAGFRPAIGQLRNESIAIEVDAATGGLRSIAAVDEPSPRLAQQLVVHGLVDAAGKPVASQMRSDRFDVDFGGPALVQATSVGQLVDPRQGNRLASFEQRYRLWTGRPILEIRVTLSEIDAAWLEQAARSDPWSVYLACRWAWPDASSMLRRTVLGNPELTELDRPETPDAIDITTRTQRTAILFGGLSYHRKHGARMLDTLLVAGARDVPVVLARGRARPRASVPRRPGPRHAGRGGRRPRRARRRWESPAGWPGSIARTSPSRGSSSSRTRGGRGWGLVFHLLETAGQSGRCRLRLFRNPTWARQVDFLGETIVDLSVEGDAVQVDLTPHELARVEVTLA